MANVTAVASGTGDVQVVTGKGRILGFSARESASSSAAAAFVLRDGTSAAGTALAFVELAADQSINGDWGQISGLEFFTGLYLDRVSGTTEVTVYT